MAAELNELFEEGITRCAELGDAVDAAMNAIDDAVEQAEEVADRVEQEGNETRQHLRDLVARLEKAEAAIEAARQEAGGSMDGLVGKAADLKHEVGALLERVRQTTALLAERRSRIDDALDAQMTESQGDFTELADRTQELEVEANRRLEQASEAIAALRSAVDDARAELSRRQEAWGAALSDLEASAREQAGKYLAGLHTLLGRQAGAMVSAANVMVARHNDTMDVIKQEFAHEAPRELVTVLEPIQASLRGLVEASAAQGEALVTRVSGLEAEMTGQMPPLADLRAALEITAELA